MGGENSAHTVLGCYVCGPSPRGWGELDRARAQGELLRTIPTWVGRTILFSWLWFSVSDHPHVGGENVNIFRFREPVAGPSPRGWGERFESVIHYGGSRTIPTWVGRTTPATMWREMRADHPHVGGENMRCQSGRPSSSGPSPRGWGERCGCEPERLPGRTIPTWVGRTWNYKGLASQYRAF